jgi:hypothetical protein
MRAGRERTLVLADEIGRDEGGPGDLIGDVSGGTWARAAGCSPSTGRPSGAR